MLDDHLDYRCTHCDVAWPAEILRRRRFESCPACGGQLEDEDGRPWGWISCQARTRSGWGAGGGSGAAGLRSRSHEH